MSRGRLDLDEVYVFGRWLIQNGERPFRCARWQHAITPLEKHAEYFILKERSIVVVTCPHCGAVEIFDMATLDE
jgi:hypothetical protein